MNILDFEKLQFLLIFCVPGIIALYSRSQFIDGKIPNFSDGLIAYSSLSLIYHAIWFLVSPSIYTINLLNASTCDKLGWVTLLFLGPIFLGSLSGISIQKQWLRKILKNFNLSTLHPIKSAWDYKFHNILPSKVMIILKDGNKWRGLLGKESFISSVSNERDIYIEQVYLLDKDGQWIEGSSSALITHDQIQSIEFWD